MDLLSLELDFPDGKNNHLRDKRKSNLQKIIRWQKKYPCETFSAYKIRDREKYLQTIQILLSERNF